MDISGTHGKIRMRLTCVTLDGNDFRNGEKKARSHGYDARHVLTVHEHLVTKQSKVSLSCVQRFGAVV